MAIILATAECKLNKDRNGSCGTKWVHKFDSHDNRAEYKKRK